MKKLTLCSVITASILLCTSLCANCQNRSYVGKTQSHVMGKDEVLENLTLKLADNGNNEYAAFLDKYKIMNFKDISISGIIKTDSDGKIIGFDKIELKGVPGKVKEVNGKIGKESADITLSGKSAGIFGFTVRYTGKVQ